MSTRNRLHRGAAAALLTTLLLAGGPAALLAQETAPPQKLAVIDVGRILEESVAGKKALAEIEALNRQKQEEAKPMVEKAQGLQKQLTDGSLSLSEDKLAGLRRDLQRAVKELKSFEDDSNEELNDLRERRLSEIERKIMPVINEVGVEGGYTMIFNKFQSGLVFASGGLDITELILERFDSATAQAE